MPLPPSCPSRHVDDRPVGRRRWFRRLAAALLLGLPVVGAHALDLDGLMQALGRVKSGEATFTERRQVQQLEQTLDSSGRLSFAAPDTFVRETLKPRRERLEVAGNTLTVTQGSRSHSMALDANPEAVAIVEAIRGTLTGNRVVLERHFDTLVGGSLERWSLELVPRDARMRGQVARVKVAGRQALLREVEITLADGDRSLMRIEPMTAPAR